MGGLLCYKLYSNKCYLYLRRYLQLGGCIHAGAKCLQKQKISVFRQLSNMFSIVSIVSPAVVVTDFLKSSVFAVWQDATVNRYLIVMCRP